MNSIEEEDDPLKIKDNSGDYLSVQTIEAI